MTNCKKLDKITTRNPKKSDHIAQNYHNKLKNSAIHHNNLDNTGINWKKSDHIAQNYCNKLKNSATHRKKLDNVAEIHHNKLDHIAHAKIYGNKFKDNTGIHWKKVRSY